MTCSGLKQNRVGMDYNRIHFSLHSNSPYRCRCRRSGPLICTTRIAANSSTSPYRDQFTTTQQVSLFAENHTELTDQLSLVTGVRRDIVHLDRDDFYRKRRHHAQ